MQRVLISLCIILWCTPVVASDLWWAVSYGVKPLGGTSLQSGNKVYGAAWNFPTRDGAVGRANAECRKHIPNANEYNCHAESWGKYGKNSCFYILENTYQSELYGMAKIYGADGPFESKEEAIIAAKNEIEESHRFRDELISVQVELVECSGAK